jgi:hypothetical protein
MKKKIILRRSKVLTAACGSILNFRMRTLNEDNAIYEDYPYQLNKSFLDAMIENFDQVGQKD